jgi:dTDP-4-dehydrorhamnose reductase
MASQRAIGVLVLGGTGMLGSMLVRVLTAAKDVHVRATYRGEDEPRIPGVSSHDVEWVSFDAERDTLPSTEAGESWIVNAIGIIKPLIREDSWPDVERAIDVNARFPYRLAAAALTNEARVIQIATDCVFSGRQGDYREDSPHDALDVYGKTKSLGEVNAAHFLNLRCSIVGPELNGHRSLLDWLVRQPRGATVKGFVNHRWNGVTTLQFAQIVLGLIRSNSTLCGTHHVVPNGALTKAELLREFATAFQRSDLLIEDAKATESIDRTLSTIGFDINEELWRNSRPTGVPTVRMMTQELARFIGVKRLNSGDATGR